VRVGIVGEVHEPLDRITRHGREEEAPAEQHDEQHGDEERPDRANLAALRGVEAGLDLVGLAGGLEAEDGILANLGRRGGLLAFTCV